MESQNNNLEPVLLWENPNPRSTFNAQTISIDTSKYNKFEIVSRTNCTSDISNYNICICRKGILNMIYNAININVYRNVEITDSGFIFGDGIYQKGIGTNGTSSEFAIPTHIYGVKY